MENSKNKTKSSWQGDALPLSHFRSMNTNYTENQQLIPRIYCNFTVTRGYSLLKSGWGQTY